MLFDEIEELRPDTEAPGIDVEQLDLPKADLLAAELAQFIGRPVTLALLDELNRAIIDFGRRHDRPVIDAFAPQGQDITNGVVQLVVVTARRGELRVEGVDGRAAARVTAQAGIGAHDLITGAGLRGELEWFNQNPFRRVNLVLERGDRFGETDLVYAVSTRRPVRFYGGVEDTGTLLTGTDRWLTGVNWGDAFGAGHQFNYQFTSAFDTGVVNAHSVSYIVPLTWRHTVELYGVYVDTDPDVDPAGFDLAGSAYQTGLRYRIPLSGAPWLSHFLEFGYDYKGGDNDLEFGRIRVSGTQTTVSQFNGAYDIHTTDRYGSNAGFLRLTVSPGGMTDDNDDEAFEEARYGASADYVYLRGTLRRWTFLPRSFTWFTELTFQSSNENLLGSEQLGVGGYDSVRGYDDYEIPADMGLYLRNEIWTPSMSLLRYVFGDGFNKFNVLLFTDYGVARSKQRLPREPVFHLWSAGVGFRYAATPYLDVRFDYGWQLKDVSTSAVGSGRAHFGILLAY